uniref:Parafibrominlike protein putative n=1 Tax=Albugo laibachii Nc14 TaxID=890382 RepID=F0W8Y6_9STRA|nr:parafibrominlike protein putative [Albugo laibachii Nc14]|eukprot:CCA17597.1 parafibrominlike protein putative [Albugo laibachii Nc14]
MEALAYIRDHFIKSKTFTIENDDILCVGLNGEELQRFPKHIPTAFHSKTSKKPYDLLAIVTCFKYATLPFGEYVTKCRAEKAGMVSTVDKKELIAYLKGDIDTSAQIYSLGSKARENDVTIDSKAASTPEKRTYDEEQAASKVSSPSKRQKTTSEGDKMTPQKSRKSLTDTQELDQVMQGISAKEQTFRNRTNIMNAPTKTFENVLKIVEAVNAEIKERLEKASKASLIAPTTRHEQVPLSVTMRERIKGTPIIVVPAGFSDLFTMYNVKDFLQDGVYVPISQKKEQGLRKDHAFTIAKEYNGEEFVFKVVDSVNRFRDKEWSCVVGVLVSGQTWQFKGWKWAFPLQVFKRVCGIHIHRQGSQLSEEIKKWDVKILMIHPDKRHLDKVAAKEFWRYLFEHIKLRLQ